MAKIWSIQVPKTKKQVRSLIGLVNFYSLFVPKYAEIVACLTELTAGQATRGNIRWLPTHDEALVQLQKALICKPILQILDLSLDFFTYLLTVQ